jgi:hypothetical protein
MGGRGLNSCGSDADRWRAHVNKATNIRFINSLGEILDKLWTYGPSSTQLVNRFPWQPSVHIKDLNAVSVHTPESSA